MPGFVPSPETMAIQINWTIHGRQQLNRLHARNQIVGPPPPGNAQTLFNALASAFTSTGYNAAMASTTELVSVKVVDLRQIGDPGIVSTGTPLPGTSVAAALPDQISLVVTERTALAGRSFRGRIYALGFASDQLTPTGTANPAVGPVVVNFWSALRTALSGVGWALAIRSPALPERPSKPGGLLPPKAFAITPVTALEMRDLIWDTQRRRTDLLRR